MSRFQKILVILFIAGFLVFCLFLTAIVGLASGAADIGEETTYKENRPHIAVLRIEGPVFTSGSYLKQLRAVNENPACKGLLVRINSPGGAVGASQEIFDLIEELRTSGLPVVSSLGNTAASGGYYIALGSGKIFATRGTLTGSIGVIARFANAGKLFEKLGVSMNVYKSGELKDAGNPFRRPTTKEREYLQQVVNEAHGQFVADICASRDLSPEQVADLADGRVLTGIAALESGLIDTLGGFESARRYIARQSGMEKPVFSETLKKKPWLEKILTGSLSFPGPMSKEIKAFIIPGIYYLWPGGFPEFFPND